MTRQRRPGRSRRDPPLHGPRTRVRLSLARTGCRGRYSVGPLLHGPLAQSGERSDGIAEAAGAEPAGSTSRGMSQESSCALQARPGGGGTRILHHLREVGSTRKALGLHPSVCRGGTCTSHHSWACWRRHPRGAGAPVPGVVPWGSTSTTRNAKTRARRPSSVS